MDGGTGKPKNVVLTVNGKTGIREVVSRTADIKLYFRRIYDLRLAETEDTSLDPDGLVFCHKDGSEIGSFKKSFQTLLEKCGVETDSFGRKRTIYSLRHTYATFRLHEGVNHYILSRNMGTSVKMLEDYYGHTSNVTMSEELTKGRAHTPTERTKRQKPKLNNATFGWLTDAENTSKPSQIHPSQPEESKIPASEPSYVDLMGE